MSTKHVTYQWSWTNSIHIIGWRLHNSPAQQIGATNLTNIRNRIKNELQILNVRIPDYSGLELIVQEKFNFTSKFSFLQTKLKAKGHQIENFHLNRTDV